MSPYVRTVKTASGARAVQIVHSCRRGSRDIEHIGSAHDDVELVLLPAVAGQRLAGGAGVSSIWAGNAPSRASRSGVVRVHGDHRLGDLRSATYTGLPVEVVGARIAA